MEYVTALLMSPVVILPQLILTLEHSLNIPTFINSEEPNCGHNSLTYYTLTHMLEKSFLCVGTIIHFAITSSTAGLSN